MKDQRVHILAKVTYKRCLELSPSYITITNSKYFVPKSFNSLRLDWCSYSFLLNAVSIIIPFTERLIKLSIPTFIAIRLSALNASVVMIASVSSSIIIVHVVIIVIVYHWCWRSFVTRRSNWCCISRWRLFLILRL